MPSWCPAARERREGKDSRPCLAPCVRYSHRFEGRRRRTGRRQPEDCCVAVPPNRTPRGSVGIGRTGFRHLPKEAPSAGGSRRERRPVRRPIPTRSSDHVRSRERVGLRPDRHRLHRSGQGTGHEDRFPPGRPEGRRVRRRSAGGAVGPRHPSRRMGSATRAEAPASSGPKPSRARRAEARSALIPDPPKRTGNPCRDDRHSDEVERVDVHVKERFRRPVSSR